jgi:integrase
MRRSISESLLRSPAARPQARPFEISDTKLQGFTLRIQPSGQQIFILRVGRSRRFTIGHAGQLSAEDARSQAIQVLANVKRGLPIWTGIRADTLTLGEFIDGDYSSWVLANRKTGLRALGRLRWCFGEWWRVPLEQITPELIERWKLRRLKAGVSPSTVHRDIAALSAALTRAVRTFRKIAENPVRLVDKPRIDRSPQARFLSEEEEVRLRAALSERDIEFRRRRSSANRWRREREYGLLPDLPYYGDHLTPAILASMNTGLRQGELLSLRWADVNLRDRLLTVRGREAKSGHTRHVPLNSEATQILTQWRSQCPSVERVFAIDSSFKTAWAALLRRAEISDFRWHDLRHHFASRLAQAGVPLNTVRELLGHGSMQMTLRYAHLAPDQRREAVERLSARAAAP